VPRRDDRGRYAHLWGVVAQGFGRGDIERCDHCGAMRDGKGKTITEAEIPAEAWL